MKEVPNTAGIAKGGPSCPLDFGLHEILKENCQRSGYTTRGTIQRIRQLVSCRDYSKSSNNKGYSGSNGEVPCPQNKDYIYQKYRLQMRTTTVESKSTMKERGQVIRQR